VTSTNRRIRIVLLLALVGAVAAVQVFLREPESTLLWGALFNSGHAPLYGVLALVVLGLLETIRPTWQRGRRYLEAFWIAFFAGAVMELLQWFGPRDPQLADLLRNTAGIAAFLAITASFDRRLFTETTRHRAAKTASLWFGAVAALCVAFLPVILAVAAVAARERALPLLCGFETVWERQHLLVNDHAELEIGKPPAAWRRDPDDLVGRVVFRPGPNSMLTLYDPYPDWTGYGSFAFTVYSELPDAVTLTLWIVDDDHLTGDWGSFKRKLEIEPGENRIDIPLSEIRTQARERELDMSRINKVVVYASGVERSFSLFFDDFRLRPRSL
jgi:VanZ family protein